MSKRKRLQRKAAQRWRMLHYNPTEAETVLKQALRKADLYFKFQPYFHDSKVLYFPDFRLWCPYYKLIIEIDGPSHKNRRWYDDQRTEWLEKKRNCHVIRFSNEEIFTKIEMVMEKIVSYQPWTAKRMREEREHSRATNEEYWWKTYGRKLTEEQLAKEWIE